MANSGNSNPSVTDCTFSGNTAVDGGICANGGGMANSSNSNPTVTDCTFSGNSADGIGGGMFNFHSSPTVTDCTFSGNSAYGECGFGGGMANLDSSPPVTGCLFIANSAGGGGAGVGGGMFNQSSDPSVTNCTFTGNSAAGPCQGLGGGMFNFDNSNPTVTSCTFSGNSATGYDKSGGGAMANYSSCSPTVTNCILWGDMPDEIGNFDPDFDHPTVSFSDVQGGLPAGTIDGGGNFDADPLFVDPDNGDFRLASGSPCIDAGHNWAVPQDTLDLDDDGKTNELIPYDLDGNPRFNADELDFDPGCGIPVVVDMGAYEYQFDPVDEVIFADLNADGMVDGADLGTLFGEWGDCVVDCCLSDLNLDGVVNGADLGILLGSWG
jgi:hypothetical protein